MTNSGLGLELVAVVKAEVVVTVGEEVEEETVEAGGAGAAGGSLVGSMEAAAGCPSPSCRCHFLLHRCAAAVVLVFAGVAGAAVVVKGRVRCWHRPPLPALFALLQSRAEEGFVIILIVFIIIIITTGRARAGSLNAPFGSGTSVVSAPP